MLSSVAKFAAEMEKGRAQGKVEGLLGIFYGKVMEKIVRHKDVGKEAVQAAEAVVACLGWESRELHMKFRETEFLREIIPLLREGNGGVEMFHVSFKAAASLID